MQTVAELVVHRFGGIRPAARLLKTHPSTLQTWLEGGLIPTKRLWEVLQCARDNGIDLTPSDLIAPPPKKRRRQ